MKKLLTITATMILACLATAGMAGAASISIANASFEHEGLSAGGSEPTVHGWTAKQPSGHGVTNPISDFNNPVPDGDEVAFVYNNTLSQSVTLQADTEFTFSVWVGWQNRFPGGVYDVGLWSGNNALTRRTNTTGPSLTQGEFTPIMMTYTTGASAEIVTIQLASTGMASFDDVSIEFDGPDVPPVSSVPLPAAATLLTMGVIGVVAFRKRS